MMEHSCHFAVEIRKQGERPNPTLASMDTANDNSMTTGFRCRAGGRWFRFGWTGVLALLWLTPPARAVDREEVLRAIAMVETGDRDIGLHPDGVTYGRYGVTYMAVRELQRLRRLEDGEVDLRNPATNRRVASLYLQYLKERYGSWWEAVRHYNPRSGSYARKVWAAMDRRRRRVSAGHPEAAKRP
jgi:hypothetical protein